MNSEETIKAALDGLFYSVDEFGTTRVKAVPKDYLGHYKPLYDPDNFRRASKPMGRKPKDWTEADDETLFRMRQAGKSWDDIMPVVRRSLKFCRARYAELCEARGVSAEYQRPGSVTPDVGQQIASMYRANHTLNEIIAATGLKPSVVYSYVRERKRKWAA